MKRFFLPLVALFIMVQAVLGSDLTGFRVCRMTEPAGITRTAQFSWQTVSKKPNVKQTAYRLRVATSKDGLKAGKGLLWDSQRTNSDESVAVPYQGRRLPYQSRIYWQVEVWLSTGEHLESPVQSFLTGIKQFDDKAKWIGEASPNSSFDMPARYLRRAFTINRKVRRATLYVSGMGYGTTYINGKPVGKDVFGTLQTDYSKTVYYNTYDVTSLLRRGNNAIASVLGNGYVLGFNKDCTSYGLPRLKAQLVVETDRDTFNVVTDKDWKVTTDGPIQRNHLYNGERYEAAREMKGWQTASFDDSRWKQADEMKAPTGIVEAQPCPGMRIQKELKAQSIRRTSDGRYIIDMGQNMVGQLRVRLNGKKDVPVVIRHAEILDPKDNDQLFVANLRSAKSTDTYIPAADGTFTYQPQLTYQGFRFVEISGISSQPKASDITGCVIYDFMEDQGTFWCDNELLNKLHENAYWGIIGNYHGMPTDCPQRDERMGWLGDHAMGCFGENLLVDNGALYYKWLRDVFDTQDDDGLIADVAPAFWVVRNKDVAWGALSVYAAYMLLRRYNDVNAVLKYYPYLQNYMRYLNHNLDDGIVTTNAYGDWCMPPERPDLIHSQDPARKTDGRLISTAMYYSMLTMMGEMAMQLGIEADMFDFDHRQEKLKEAYNRHFYHPETASYSNNTVTANLLSLEFGLVPDGDEERVMQNITDVTRDTYRDHVSCGVLGMQHLLTCLTHRGHLDQAMRIILQKDYPGFGYMMEKGATTIWELWNGDTADPAMNSGNHVMLLGDVLVWMYNDLAGIRQSPYSRAYKELDMYLSMPEELNHVRATHGTPYGTVKSEWWRTEEGITWEVDIPANTSARIHIPSGFTVQGMVSLRWASAEVEDDGICLLVGSGSYTINAYKVFTAPQQTIFRRMTETLKNIPEFLKNF
ncbi:MAG: family 78 glycoside hydrolase catalytic domain [Bacteroidaceae bacterium]|nr:family 78 glycoside hydrolase catalytic domain [Bacteroidaceae bacterium]MBR4517002.1 family 78 glycoside hydrolase catalytic domain [Bacteroidaceae bacterium]